jgi:hypothetical protein
MLLLFTPTLIQVMTFSFHFSLSIASADSLTATKRNTGTRYSTVLLNAKVKKSHLGGGREARTNESYPPTAQRRFILVSFSKLWLGASVC